MSELALLPLQAGVDSTTVLAAMAIGFLINLVIAIAAGYWVYKDASKRENNELAWGIGVGALLFLLFPVGVLALIAYVLLRGDETASEPMGSGAAGGEW